ncbi:efflux RND transporter periplasmic adaptor subunit [Ferrovibrio sp.]|jgi:Cu(I)/Ag(I) efflux system membrane fusion protein|uniref:efflux RND transporter periplasmic adaptor subunit n=1 Tax=Ferrovibrio sp. TaxID=1917215 RepID=UPI000CC96715|nr:efflux RND transporter periplasmic adaptor subunit [Ferrovibrio sp.]PJI41828.1 MAG: efflux transporter periplasmic adaptor subunit [Ferrovibrio sp.]
MTRPGLILAGVAIAALAGAGGYFVGTYGLPGGLRRDAAQPAMTANQSTTDTPKAEKKLLYYRNPMGLPDVSPAPKKDWMGMDYIPVYEGEDEGVDRGIKLSPQKVQLLGVRTEEARSRMLSRPIRATASFQFDERRQVDVTVKYEAWIEKLLVNATGEPVKAGQTMMLVYSPAMVQAQEEYLLAARLRDETLPDDRAARNDADRLVQGALARLRNLDLPRAVQDRLVRTGQVSRQFAIAAPMQGIVTDKGVVEGMRIMPGDRLYRLVDDSQLWLQAEVFEQDIGLIKPGQPVEIAVNAYPNRTFTGKVAFIYPTVNRDTRTARVRIEVPNPDGALKADMYASVLLNAQTITEEALAVPESAVIDSGRRQIVIVDIGMGRFDPREVKLGARGDGYVEVRDGLEEGEAVVVQANFLLDAEANLKAALQSFAPPPATAGQSQGPEMPK